MKTTSHLLLGAPNRRLTHSCTVLRIPKTAQLSRKAQNDLRKAGPTEQREGEWKNILRDVTS